MPETRHCAISCGAYSTDGKKCGISRIRVRGFQIFLPQIFYQHSIHPCPYTAPSPTQRITQDEFKQIAGEVMQHVFTIHNEFGRFFDEQIYTKKLVDRRHIANQRMRLAAPNVAFKITALRSRLGEFESHATRLIRHTTLKTVHWAHITQASVTFTTVTE